MSITGENEAEYRLVLVKRRPQLIYGPGTSFLDYVFIRCVRSTPISVQKKSNSNRFEKSFGPVRTAYSCSHIGRSKGSATHRFPDAGGSFSAFPGPKDSFPAVPMQITSPTHHAAFITASEGIPLLPHGSQHHWEPDGFPASRISKRSPPPS